MLLAKYAGEASAMSGNDILNHLKLAQIQSKDLKSSQEQVCYKLALFCDLGESQSPKSAIDYYGKSLHFGSRYLYHSLPRMLTLWLDYAKVTFPMISLLLSQKLVAVL